MPFKEILGSVVDSVQGGVGAVIVDDEGEAVDLVTRGDGFETRLAGAHQGIVLALVDEAARRIRAGDSVLTMAVRSDRFTYTVMPVKEGLAVILVQDQTGLPSQGMRALENAAHGIVDLI